MSWKATSAQCPFKTNYFSKLVGFELVDTLSSSTFLKELWNLAMMNFGIQRYEIVGMEKNKTQTHDFIFSGFRKKSHNQN